MNQLEARPLRYFVAVAHELSFVRAAERVGIAGPALSRAISQLETLLEVKLFERTTRHVALTDAGVVLLDQAQVALDALDAAARRTQRAAGPQRRLVVALKADLEGGLLEQAMEAHRRERTAVPIEILLGGWAEQPQQLREGQADVALLYQPFDERELDYEVLLEERPLVALPAEHPLAACASLRVQDLEREYQRTTGPYIWEPRRPDGIVRDPPQIGEISRLLRMIELGEVIAVLPESVTERFIRPEISYCSVRDAPPVRLAVAWPESSYSLATAAFVRVVTELAAGERSIDEPDAPLELPAKS